MPKYKVTAPTGQAYNVNTPEGATEQDAIAYLSAQLGGVGAATPGSESPESILERFKQRQYAGGNALTRGLSRGVDVAQMGYGSALEGIGKGLGLKGLEEYGGEVVAEQEEELAAKAPYATRLKDVREAEGVFDTAGELASFTGSALGESAPQMGTTIGGSLAGAAAGARMGAIAGIPGTVIGGIAGGLLANVPFFYGMNREAQKEAVADGIKIELNEGAALLASIPQALLDLVADRFLFGLGSRAGVNVEKFTRQGGLFTRGVKGAVAGATVEVPTEIGQQVIERFQAGMPIDSPEAIEEYFEVGAAAGLVGGSIRSAVNVIGGDPEARAKREEAERLAAIEAKKVKEQKDAEAENQRRNEAFASGQATQETLDFDATDEAEATAAGVVPDEAATPLDVEVNRHRRNLEQYRTDGTGAEVLLLEKIEQLEADIRAATYETIGTDPTITIEKDQKTGFLRQTIKRGADARVVSGIDAETIAKKRQELNEAREDLEALRIDEDQFKGEGIPPGRRARKPKFEYADPTAGLAPELVNAKDQLLDEIYDLKINTPPDADAETLATIDEEVRVREQAIAGLDVQIDAFVKKNRKDIKTERTNSTARLKELGAVNVPALGVVPQEAVAYETVGGEQVSLFDLPLVEQDRPKVPLVFAQGTTGNRLLESGRYTEEDFENPRYRRSASSGKPLNVKKSGLTSTQIEEVQKSIDTDRESKIILDNLNISTRTSDILGEGFESIEDDLNAFNGRFQDDAESKTKLRRELKAYQDKVIAREDELRIERGDVVAAKNRENLFNIQGFLFKQTSPDPESKQNKDKSGRSPGRLAQEWLIDAEDIRTYGPTVAGLDLSNIGTGDVSRIRTAKNKALKQQAKEAAQAKRDAARAPKPKKAAPKKKVAKKKVAKTKTERNAVSRYDALTDKQKNKLAKDTGLSRSKGELVEAIIEDEARFNNLIDEIEAEQAKRDAEKKTPTKKASKKKATKDSETVDTAADTQTDPTKINENVEAAPKEGSIEDYFTPLVLKAYEEYAAKGEIPFTYEELKELQAKGLIKVTKTGKILKSTLKALIKRLETVRNLRDNAEQGVIDAVGKTNIELLEFTEKSAKNSSGSYGELAKFVDQKSVAIEALVSDMMGADTTLDGVGDAKLSMDSGQPHGLKEENFGAVGRAAASRGEVGAESDSPFKLAFPYTGGKYGLDFFDNLKRDEQLAILNEIAEPLAPVEDAPRGRVQPRKKSLADANLEISELVTKRDEIQDELSLEEKKDDEDKDKNKIAELEKAADSISADIAKKIGYADLEISELETERDKIRAELGQETNRTKIANLEEDLRLILEDIERVRYREIEQRADGLEEIRNMAALELGKTRIKIDAIQRKTRFGVKEKEKLARLRKEEKQYEDAYKEADEAYVDFVNLQTKYFTATGPEGEVIENSFIEGNPLAATRHGVLSDEKRGLEYLEKPPSGPLQQSPIVAISLAQAPTYSSLSVPPPRHSIPFEEKVYPKTTVAKVKAAILSKFGKAGVDRITVAANPEKAGLTDIKSTAAGVFIDGKVYLFTDNIAEGNELGVLLHELGVHAGMPVLVGEGNYKFLINKIKQFAKADDGSRESQLAKRAFDRVRRAEKIVDVDRDDELIAYFVEEAVNSGINPTAERTKKTKIGIWFRRFMAGVKNLLNKRGFKFKDSFNAQELVDIAYGGADFAIRNPDAKFTYAENAIKYSVATLVDGGAMATPAYAKAKDLMNAPFRSMHNAAPVWSQNTIDGILNSLSNIPDYLSRAWYTLLSLRQMADIVDRFGDQFKPIADGLRKLNDLVNQRRYKIDVERLAWQDSLLNAQEHKKGYTDAALQEFYEITHESTLEEIDLRSTAPEVTNTNLYKRYMNVINKSSDLSKYDLRKSYKIMADAYEAAGNRLIAFYKKNAHKDQLEEDKDGNEVLKTSVKKELGFITDAKGNIVPYFPLVREGAWWVDYTRGGETFTVTFESKREAELAAKELEQDDAVTLDKKRGAAVYKRTRNDELADSGVALKQLDEVERALERSLPSGPEKDLAIKQIKDTILKAYPSQSLKQQFKKRKGTKGFRQDVFQNFAHMGLKFSNELSLLENVDELNAAIGALEAEGGGKVPPAIANVIDSVQRRAKFMRNPTPGALYSKLSWGGYTWFILGNISSAIINLTQIPLVTYGLLAGEFGHVKAAAAIKDGFKAYLKFHKDDNTRLKVLGVPLADRTAFGGDFMTPEMKILYDAALTRGIVRRTTSQELQEAKFGRVDSMTGRLVKTEMALGYVFQNSERANREVSLIAAYKLAKEKYGNKKISKDSDITIAMERAFELVEQANGPALAEAGPQLFQDGWGKVIGTFKRFALSQLYLQYKLLRDINPLINKLDKDPKLPEGAPSARSLAIKQFIAISGSAWLFAGAKGLPVYGAAELSYNLAKEALGDEDDLDEDFNMVVRGWMGDISFRGPLSHFTNLDFASRTGFYGLMYRDDPYRRAEVGDLSYFVETLSGPAYAAFIRNPSRAISKFNEGDLYGAIQTATPSFIRNAMKGFSLATEGAVNSKGVPIVEDVSFYNAMMQLLGFTPTNLSNAYQMNEFLSRQARKISKRKSKLLQLLNMARTAGDTDGMQETREAIDRFNLQEIVIDTKQQIGGKTIKRSWGSWNNYLDQAVRGLRLQRDVRLGLTKRLKFEGPEDM